LYGTTEANFKGWMPTFSSRPMNGIKNTEGDIKLLLPDCLHGLLPGPFLLSYSVFVFIFSLLFCFCAVP